MTLRDTARHPAAQTEVIATSLQRCRHQWRLTAGSYIGRCAACGCLGLFASESLALLTLIAPSQPAER